ncbi:hemin binding protein [Legionella quinlivanii]|uniref:Hemin binding protein n=1 Tax=Legionella quinlivanii TaxID=45073 RepID=A0A0W0Y6P8_9GAMM|nr:DUF4949 domain-containing protein [Legionella quinlivanii]KTD52621.1 hemin binding protein [Legionella quinlivanii]MCW8451497.1 DUF4949 domain-containing protein [Legionella quinlivanii]SEG26224.1 protein of unknown function [Legionella quinlivanii DSM 21216]STY10301.1 hemin binding protein Hbp [Legionella quinlivanii]
MKRVLQSFSLALLVSSSAFAFNESPEKCPSVESLQAIGISDAIDIDLGWVGLNWSNYYDTQDKWTFGIYVGQVKGKEVAIKKGNRLIKSIKSSGGPTPDGYLWACEYQNPQGQPIAMAITPPVNPGDMMRRLVK